MTMAELGVALAAFSGIFMALVRTQADVKAYQLELGTTSILGNAFVVVVLSILPVVLSKFGWEESTIWTFSGSILISYVVLVAWPMIYIYQKAERIEPVPKAPLTFSLPLHVVVVIMQVLNVSSAFGPSAVEGPYFLGVAMWLLMYFYVFIWLVQDMSGSVWHKQNNRLGEDDNDS